MVRLREIPRTATFAWSPGSALPLIATGTRAGAVDADFSSETVLELWDLGLDQVEQAGEEFKNVGSISTDSRFHDIAWNQPTSAHPNGVIAGALETGSLDLWDASKLRIDPANSFIARQSKHTGGIKALQFNSTRNEVLASGGAKGELYVTDISQPQAPYRLGAQAARADDIECLDWNKKTPKILGVGSSGGFVTVWDVQSKRESLTLNNLGRKAVSALAWDPEVATRLVTATSNDQDPVILVWDLRNSSVPERTLKGHELGVLGVSWCQQDSDLLLSCGKDNRTMCWNPRTGDMYGEISVVTNWTYETRWNPHNPSLVATASFDGKISIETTQNTNSKSEDKAATQALDGEDFFAKVSTQPQTSSFSLPKAPKWMERPVGASFGFGGKLVMFGTEPGLRQSKLAIEIFAVDSSLGEATEQFEKKLRGGDLTSICEAKIVNAKTEDEKADWQVIETLNEGKSRKKLREYLGFSDDVDELSSKTAKPAVNGDKPETNGTADDDAFFGNGDDDDNFLANLASTKGARTNNPFSIYSGEDSEADKGITRALMLGQFEQALDICLQDGRMSDAFMIAVCGGQKCIDKSQNAYLKSKANGPKYLRLLASIVGKNLWDVVHNADLANWKEVMATICTYANENEFSDLCEALGDRLEDSEGSNARRDASFCYLAGAKLEKVVVIWVQELHEQEKAGLDAEDGESVFSVHVKSLQDFVEKVTVFRQVTNFRDSEVAQTADWKLAPLYSKYSEYADILASHGQLQNAEKYLNLLPGKYQGAEAAQKRVKQATRKAAPQAAAQRQPTSRTAPMPQPLQPIQPSQPSLQPTMQPPQNVRSSAYAPANPINSSSPALGLYGAPSNNVYQPPRYQPPAQSVPYGQLAHHGAAGYGQPQQQGPPPPPPRASNASPSQPPPSLTKNMTNWNDMPDTFFKPPTGSRRGTPGPPPTVGSSFPNQPLMSSPAPPPGPPGYGQPQRQSTSPLPPPPKAGQAPPGVSSLLVGPPQHERPSSSTAGAYTPSITAQQPPTNTLPTPAPPPVNRGASPYQPPPATSQSAPSSRYAPAPGSHPSQQPGMPPPRNVAPNPYGAAPSPYAANQIQPGTPYGQPQQPSAPPPRADKPPTGPPRTTATPFGRPPSGPPGFVTAPPPPKSEPSPRGVASAGPNPDDGRPRFAGADGKQTYPRGDRSHISTAARPIFDLLSPEMARIKAVAPQTFMKQVLDTEQRLNILFDHLNNNDLLSQETVDEMVQISRAVAERRWDEAQSTTVSLMDRKKDAEGGKTWMPGVKRLIAMGKATKI